MSSSRSAGWLLVMGTLSGWGLFAVKLAISFVRVRVLLNSLPDAAAGIWFTMLTLLGYVQMFDFGTGVTLARYLAYARGGKFPQNWHPGETGTGLEPEQQVVADLVATVARYFRTLGVVVLVLFLGGGLLYLPTLADGPLSASMTWTWVVMALAAFLTLEGFTYTAAIYGSNGVHVRDSVFAVTMLVGFGLMLLFLRLGWGLVGVSLSLLIETGLRLLLLRLALMNMNPFLRLANAGRAQWPLLRQMIGPSVRMGVVMVAEILILQTDNVIIATRLGPAAVPNYNVAYQLGFTLFSLMLVVNAPLVALAAKAYVEQDNQRLRNMLGVNMRFGFALMLLGAALLASFGDDVIALWVGAERFVGFPVLWLILLVMVFESFKVFHFRLVTATDSIPFVPWAVVAVALNLALSYFLAPRWGWLGVTFGTLASQAITLYWYVPYHTARAMKFELREYARLVVPVVGFGFAVTAAALAVSYGLDLTAAGGRPLIHLLAGSLLIALPALLVHYRFILLASERAYLRDRAAVVLGRVHPVLRAIHSSTGPR